MSKPSNWPQGVPYIDPDVHYVGPTVLRGMAGGELANLGNAVYVIQVDARPVAVLCSYATATEAEQDDADTLQANRLARDLLAQMEARALAAEARAKALEAALRDLRTAARNGRGLISRMRDYVPVRSDFWERYSEAQIAEMLAALETADERAAAALKGEA